MLFISTSMYWEACPLIQRLHLKKVLDIQPFQVFRNKDTVLIISGIGKIKAAIAITYLLSHFKPKKDDVLVNIGICGTGEKEIPVGKTFLCSKIIDHDSKRTYYPDMLLRSPFHEASLETFSKNVHSGSKVEGTLLDMEASGFYEAASCFMQPHQIFFLKIVSDHLEQQPMGKEWVIQLMESNIQTIVDWLNDISEAYRMKEIFSPEERRIIRVIASNLKCSTAMAHQLTQLLTYEKLKSGSLSEEILLYQSLQCKTKNEGKRCLEKIKERIIESSFFPYLY